MHTSAKMQDMEKDRPKTTPKTYTLELKEYRKDGKQLTFDVVTVPKGKSISQLQRSLGKILGEFLRVDKTTEPKPRVRCQEINPATNKQCELAEGHFGTHQEDWSRVHGASWITKCKDKECDYHHNSKWIHDEKVHVSWNECIHCGTRKSL